MLNMLAAYAVIAVLLVGYGISLWRRTRAVNRALERE